MLISPYKSKPRSGWRDITEKLVSLFPLDMKTLVAVTEAAWADLYTASFGDTGLRIGSDIFLPAQATGVILERLIAVHLHRRYPEWRGGNAKAEKDVVCENELKYSFEIKTRPRAAPDCMATAAPATGQRGELNFVQDTISSSITNFRQRRILRMRFSI